MQTTSEFSNLVDMLMQRAAASADTLMATVVSDHGKQEGRMTFGELDAAARQIGEQLVQRGLAGRNLLLLYPPGLDYIKAFFACLYGGSVPVPAYPPTGNRDLTRLYNIAFLQYTSGSTGHPKGVMVSHGNTGQFRTDRAGISAGQPLHRITIGTEHGDLAASVP